jgi:hypothetical protein
MYFCRKRLIEQIIIRKYVGEADDVETRKRKCRMKRTIGARKYVGS